MWEPALLGLPDACPQVDFEEHRTRFKTLQAIARQYRENPERFGIVNVWRPKDMAVLAPWALPAAAGRESVRAAE